MPKLTHHYSHALVRIAVLTPVTANKDERAPLQLVGAVISLLADDNDVPARAVQASCFRLPKNGRKQGSLFYDEVVMTAEQALAWYRSQPDTLVTPVPAHASRSSDGQALQSNHWQDLPNWPTFGVHYSEESTFYDVMSNHLPFSVAELTQYHRRLTADKKWAVESANSFAGLIVNDPDAIEFLQQRLHINFHDYPEYLGGMCLLAPSTLVRNVDLSLERCEQGHESLAIQVIAQPGKDLNGLFVIYTAVQNDVLTHCQQYPVPPSGLVRIAHKGKLHQTALVLTHEEQGVLLQQPLTSFCRQISSRMSVSSMGNRVSVPSTDATDAPQTTYAVAGYLDSNVSVLGEGPSAVEERIARSAGARSLRLKRQRYEQQWFSAGDREEALKFVRSKLGHAQKRIIIADPYFNALQIEQLLYAVQQGHCEVNVLTNADVFKGAKKKHYRCKKTQEEAQGETQEKEVSRLSKVQEFDSAIKKLLSTHSLYNLQIKVAVHAEAKFHDRFLIVDQNAWLLGSSLNSLGTQPTMIIRIPDAKVVIDEIEALMAKAESFTNYFRSLQ